MRDASDARRHVIDAFDDALDVVIHFSDGKRNFVRKIADLCRDDIEATSMLTCACRLDCGIECEKVGLGSDFANRSDNIRDRLRLLLESM